MPRFPKGKISLPDQGLGADHMSWPGAEVRQEVLVESTLPACFDVPDMAMPNAETVVAIEELEAG